MYCVNAGLENATVLKGSFGETNPVARYTASEVLNVYPVDPFSKYGPPGALSQSRLLSVH